MPSKPTQLQRFPERKNDGYRQIVGNPDGDEGTDDFRIEEEIEEIGSEASPHQSLWGTGPEALRQTESEPGAKQGNLVVEHQPHLLSECRNWRRLSEQAHELAPGGFLPATQLSKGVGKAQALIFRKFKLELPSFGREAQPADPAVFGSRRCENKLFFEQAAERRVERLFGSAEDFNEPVDAEVRIAADKVEDAMVDAREALTRENLVRPGDRGAKCKMKEVESLVEFSLPV